MPRGRPRKQPPASTANAPDYDRILRSMEYAVDQELNGMQDETRKRILEEFKDALDIIRGIAHGIRVVKSVVTFNGVDSGIVCPRCGDPTEEVVYTVPPYWPALKWIAEWGRQIIKEAPKKEVEHRLDPVALDLIRQQLQLADGPVVGGLLPQPNENGVIDLKD